MEYSLFSRDAEEQGQIDACKELGMAMMAYAVLGRGMLSAQVPWRNWQRTTFARPLALTRQRLA
jgi:aryl-alcohol dehydrogenase-like predicted oxidoreductase